MRLTLVSWMLVLSTLTAVTHSQTVAAQLSYQHDSDDVVLPSTPAGQCAKAYLRAFNAGSDDEYRAYVLKYRTAEYLKRNPIEKLLAMYRMIYEQSGRLSLVRIARESDDELVVLFRSSRSNRLIRAGFKMDGAEPPHLQAFTISPLDSEEAAGPATVDDELMSQTIASVATILREQYVYPEKGEHIASALEEHYARGDFSGHTDGVAFALAVSQALKVIGHDGHLGLEYGKPPDNGEVAEAEEKAAAAVNYGFRKVEIFPNNIGYIAFDQCHHSENARQVAAQALAKVADCEVLVFDITRNQGGSPELIGVVMSYLFDAPTLLGSRYSRIHEDSIREYWSFTDVPGRRFDADVPVYILTSSHTCSAAEAFAVGLQELKRATVVGEATCGSAHTAIQVAVNDKFWMSIPYGRGMGPVSKKDWEGVGVVPDIQVSPDDALEAACDHALGQLDQPRR